MALPFINSGARKREQVVAIDLGGRTTKAVSLTPNKAGGFLLTRYGLLDAPAPQKTFSAELLGDHLKSIVETLDSKTKSITLSVGVSDSIVRQAELPQIPVHDVRMILKNNSKAYLQQDLPNHVFDCFFIPNRASGKADDKTPKPALTASPKLKALVAGAKMQFIDEMLAAASKAGFTVDAIVPGIIGPINAFESSSPDVFQKDVVALLDFGFKNTTVCLMREGELVLSRVVAIGGDKITGSLAELMGISYAEAESIKLGMPAEVQPHLESLLVPLGRELRASIDFFEHHEEKHVNQVYVTGAAAQSEFIAKILETELTISCKQWNPLAGVQLSLPAQQMAEVEQVAPQLATAIGTALATI